MAAERADSARVCFAGSLLLRRGLLALDSSHVQARRDMMVALGWLGDAELLVGNTQEGEAAYLEGLALRRALLGPQSSISDREDLASALERLVDLALQRGDPAAAVRLGRESLGMRRQLALDLGMQPSTAQALSLSLAVLARALDASGENGTARALMLECMEIQRDRLAADPDDATLQHSFAARLSELAALQEPAEARTNLEEACQRLRSLHEQRQSPRLSGDLANTLSQLGETCTALQDAPAALEAFREALVVLRRQLAEAPENLRLQRELSLGLERMGRFWMAVGRPAAAREVLAECVALRRALAGASPHGGSSRDLCIALAQAGEAAAEDNDALSAQSLHEEGRDIARHWLEREPDSPGARYNLAFAEFSLARDAERQQRVTEAVACLERALAVLEPLAGTQERSFREFLQDERSRLLADPQ